MTAGFRMFHTMSVVVANQSYRCMRCNFWGDLREAIAHAIERQLDMTSERP